MPLIFGGVYVLLSNVRCAKLFSGVFLLIIDTNTVLKRMRVSRHHTFVHISFLHTTQLNFPIQFIFILINARSFILLRETFDSPPPPGHDADCRGIGARVQKDAQDVDTPVALHNFFL